MTRAWLQFTARKRQPWDGEPYRWRHGPFTSRAAAEDHAREVRGRREYAKHFARKVRLDVVTTGRGPWQKPAAKLRLVVRRGSTRRP